MAALRPQPPVPPSVRKLPQAAHGLSIPTAVNVHTHVPVSSRELAAPRPAGAIVEPSVDAAAHALVQHVPHAAIQPLAPEQYLVKFTASRAMHDKLREAQALLRHQVPSGNVAEIFDRALTLLLADLRKRRHAATSRPRSPHRPLKPGRARRCGSEARSLGPRRGAMRVRRRRGPVHGTRIPGVSPRDPVCRWR